MLNRLHLGASRYFENHSLWIYNEMWSKLLLVKITRVKFILTGISNLGLLESKSHKQNAAA